MSVQIGQTIRAEDFANLGAGQNGSSPQVGQTISAQDFQKLSTPGLLQKVGNVAGKIEKFVGNTVLGAPINLASRIGQLGGVGIAGAASKLTGNPQYYQNAMNVVNSPQQFPVGKTDIKPIEQENTETIAGQGLGTVALGIHNPAVAGGLIGASDAMRDKGSIGDVALRGGIGSLAGWGAGKVVNYALNKIAPSAHFAKMFTNSGVPSDVSGGAAQTLSNLGIRDLSSQQAVMRAGGLVNEMADVPMKLVTQRALEQLAKWMSAAPAKSGGGLLSKLAIPATIVGTNLWNRYGGAVEDLSDKALSGGSL